MDRDLLTRVELAVSLRNFVNIELHSQGWYAIRFKFHVNGNGSGIRAVFPTAIVQPDKDSPVDQLSVLEPFGFRTRIFRIRYCYEEVDISETIVMQV